MNQSDNRSDKRIVAVVVEADDAGTAKGNAIQLMADTWYRDYMIHDFYAARELPNPLLSTEAYGLLESFWSVMREGYVESIVTILDRAIAGTGNSDLLLEDTDFRRACAQVGSLEGEHILIYGPVLDPVITYSNIKNLRLGMPQKDGTLTYDPDKLWVVVVEIQGRWDAYEQSTPTG